MHDPEYSLKNPPHVGGFIRTEIVEAHALTVTAAAEVLGVTRQALSPLLNEHASLSPDMALRIEKAFGVKMDTTMRMQNAYDIAQARAREDEIKISRYVPKKNDGPVQPRML